MYVACMQVLPTLIILLHRESYSKRDICRNNRFSCGRKNSTVAVDLLENLPVIASVLNWLNVGEGNSVPSALPSSFHPFTVIMTAN